MRQSDNPRPLAYRTGPYMRARLVERGALDAKIAEADTVELDRAGALTLLVGLGEIAQQITAVELIAGGDRKSTRLNSSHVKRSRMPSSA